MKNQNYKTGEIVIYQAHGIPMLEVRLEKDTVWLNAHLIAKLFCVNRPAIVKHINNIYRLKELERKTTCSILEQVAADGKVRKMNLYNLDMIISVGYRVNSKRATHFRIWATKTLKEHLIRGYTINENRLLQTKSQLKDLQNTISFLHEKSKQEFLAGQEQEILNLLASYAKTFSLLEQYDLGKLKTIKKAEIKFTLEYEEAVTWISKMRRELVVKKEASNLFGQESSQAFRGILSTIYQTFDGRELYLSLEEKAAHLLYFIIKDHPFIDGNKRIASFLFIYFLERNDYLYRDNGEKKINDNALTALSLLVAISEPKEKDKLIKIVTNLLA